MKKLRLESWRYVHWSIDWFWRDWIVIFLLTGKNRDSQYFFGFLESISRPPYLTDVCKFNGMELTWKKMMFRLINHRAINKWFCLSRGQRHRSIAWLAYCQVAFLHIRAFCYWSRVFLWSSFWSGVHYSCTLEYIKNFSGITSNFTFFRIVRYTFSFGFRRSRMFARSTDSQFDRLIDWWIDCSVVWSTDWQFDRLIDWLFDCLAVVLKIFITSVVFLLHSLVAVLVA